MPLIDFGPDRLNNLLADGYLIKFRHERNYLNDNLLIRATCYTLSGIQITNRCEASRVDREVHPASLRLSVNDGAHILNSMRGNMAADLVMHAPVAGNQSCTLIPTRDVEELHREVQTGKRDMLHLAGQSMKVRNDALRWKSLAKKLKAERDALLDKQQA